MNNYLTTQMQTATKPAFTLLTRGILQRQCGYGQHTSVAGECEEYNKKREGMLQRAAVNNALTTEVPPIVDEVLHSPGQPLDTQTRAFMEPRFGHDFSRLRVHTDAKAAESARAVNALAYTVGKEVVFGAGHFAPRSLAGQRLIAHELTHVVQQRDAGIRPQTKLAISDPSDMSEREADSTTNTALSRINRNPINHTSTQPLIQRAVEVRPPGRGEASAFDRRQELIDRLNTLSTAIQYRLEGRRIVYDLIDESVLTNLDRQMRGFIDRAEVVPMRLITSAGFVGGGPLLFDSFILGYVDLDDLLASDDHAFQIVLLHFLTERFQVRNYARRIGTNLDPEFARAHRAGREAETEFFRELIGDPTIRFNYDETRPNGTLVVAWRSQEGYRIFHVIRRATQAERGGELFVQTRDGRRLTIEDLIAERAAAAPAAP
jgi:hypothetical protein